MKELKPYLRRSLATVLSIKFFYEQMQETLIRVQASNNVQFSALTGIARNEKNGRTVIERDEEDWI